MDMLVIELLEVIPMDMLAIELLEVIPMRNACHRTVGSYSNGHA